MKRLCVAVAALLFAAPLPAQVNQNTPGWFPFNVPGLDATPGPIDLSGRNEKPAGKNGFLRAGDGVIRDGVGNRVRLFGVNVSGDACFPPKTDAPAIAKHLAKQGINIVRLHHMDYNWPNGQTALLHYNGDGRTASDDATFNLANLDRLDFLIGQLKKNGIYVNLNLHVSRTYPGTPAGYDFSKGLDYFYPPYIARFQEFARRLLTHINPYTGLAYRNEPAIACIEVNNENSVHLYDLPSLPEPFASALRIRWIAYLKIRYPTTALLRAAWGVQDDWVGPNLVPNPDFAHDGAGWYLDSQGGAAATLRSLTGESGGRWQTTRAGTESWHLQLSANGLPVAEGKAYRLSFDARSNANRSMSAYVGLDQAPWSAFSGYFSVGLTTAWRRFGYELVATGAVPYHSRVTFGANNQVARFDLRQVALQEISNGALRPDETYESGNIPFTASSRNATARLDWYRFLFALEQDHVREMRTFLQRTLGVRQMLYHSQVAFGGLAALLREQNSDLVDSHAYWQHPNFPGTPWDPTNWFIDNTPQVAQRNGGAIAGLAIQRLAGKPFTVSEYNHPAPSDYAAEALPTLAIVGALQDWDGLYFFDYASFTTHLNGDTIRGFFGLQGHPAQEAFLPLASLLFRNGLIQPAQNRLEVAVSEPWIRNDRMQRDPWGGFDRLWSAVGLPSNIAFQHRLSIQAASSQPTPTLNFLPTLVYPSASDTGEVVWDSSLRRLTVRAPAARLALGKIGNSVLTLGDLRVTVGSIGGNQHGHLGIASLDGRALAATDRALLVAIGRAENQNMGWNARRTSVGSRWGTGPAVAQGIPATFTFIGSRWTIQKLSPAGAPTQTLAANVSRFTIQPADRTLWYLLTRQP